MQTARGRGRGGAVRATVTRGGHNLTNTGNGTIILILSFISLTLLGKSEECGEMQTARGRGRGRGGAVRATATK